VGGEGTIRGFDFKEETYVAAGQKQQQTTGGTEKEERRTFSKNNKTRIKQNKSAPVVKRVPRKRYVAERP